MVLIYVITNNLGQAKTVCQELLKKRLANSVNILPAIQTFKWENDEVMEDHDCIVLIKTKALLYSRIEELICNVLEREDPAIFSMPMTQINHPYQDLLREDTIAV